MADFATVWYAGLGQGDWFFTAPQDGLITDETGASILDDQGAPVNDGLFVGTGQLTVGNDLYTAVLISIFTDAEAGVDDVIPDSTSDPRGWWGDLGADRPIGSKLWLLSREKQTNSVLALAQSYIADALQWLIDDGVAVKIDVATEWTRPGLLDAQITISRADGTKVATRFDWAWTELN